MGKKKKDKIRLKALLTLPEKEGQYFNRELSWIKFNERILYEAENPANPLLERVNYLGIVAGNLDEFFMVRVPEYQRSASIDSKEFAEVIGTDAPLEQIYSRVIVQMRDAAGLWRNELAPALEEQGITIMRWAECTDEEKRGLKKLVKDEPFTILRGEKFTDIRHDEFLQGFALLIETSRGRTVIPIQEIINTTGRFLPVGNRRDTFIFAEDVIKKYVPSLFPDEDIYVIFPVRLTRDSDLSLKGDDADDLAEALKEAPEALARKLPSRLETLEGMPFGYTAHLVKALSLPPELVYDVRSSLGLADLKELPVEHPELRFPKFTPGIPEGLEGESAGIFAAVSQGDRLLFTPYQSFDALVNFLHAAADDPDVLKISMTLYRLGAKSPVADALVRAAQNGKEVTAVVELKASFDEERNFLWSKKLAENGVKVIYGVPGLKCHAKCCLVVRREKGVRVRYSTLSTGNYNAKTAAIYSDLSLFTANQEIGEDLELLFEQIASGEIKNGYRHLAVSPVSMTGKLTGLIAQEIEHQKKSGNGHIIMKVNSLSDKTIINALYAASKEGVKVELCVRGVCMLRPGVPGMSENISVVSVVGRFLEHARIFYFGGGGRPQVYIGSPDMMPRNLLKRVEILCPVLDSVLRQEIAEDILPVWMNDTKGYRLDAGGRYRQLERNGQRSQEQFIEMFRRRG